MSVSLLEVTKGRVKSGFPLNFGKEKVWYYKLDKARVVLVIMTLMVIKRLKIKGTGRTLLSVTGFRGQKNANILSPWKIGNSGLFAKYNLGDEGGGEALLVVGFGQISVFYSR